MFALERNAARTGPWKREICRQIARYSTESGEGSSSSAESSSSASTSKPTARNQEAIEQLWDRVLRAPAAVHSASPQTARPQPSLLASSTPSPRTLKGTRTQRHRAAGQTPQEAKGVNAALAQIFQHLQSTSSPKIAQPGKSWAELLRPPQGWRSGPRVEDDTPELALQIDALAEELAALSTPNEVVQWAKDRVFVRTPDGKPSNSPPPKRWPGDGAFAPRAMWPKTYPRALAALIRTLWVRLNSPHLALAMFEHARNLGVESYLAGCQTSAYNELICVRWEAFRDLGGVLAAVKEMEAHAVAWDRGTSEAVGAVVSRVARDLLENRGRERWGTEAYSQLAELEAFVQRDTARHDAAYVRNVGVKRAMRQGREVRDPWRRY